MPVASTIPPPPPLKLNAKAVLDPGTFQQKWRQLPISLSQLLALVIAICKCRMHGHVPFLVNALFPLELSSSISLSSPACLNDLVYIARYANQVSEIFSISPEGVAALTTPQSLLRHMQGHSIHCIASGGQAPNFNANKDQSR
ncbi:hypothetical protein Ancab_002175 [Ancistrocladus abbreviatus]